MAGEALLVGGTWQIVRTSRPRWRRDLDPELQFVLTPDQTLIEIQCFRRRQGDGARLHTRLLAARQSGETWTSRRLGRPWAGGRWRLLEAQARWCVMWREKGLFRPSGVDICAREGELSPRDFMAALAVVENDAAAAGSSSSLYAPASVGDGRG